MPQRHYLFSLRIGHALREVAAEGYGLAHLKKDLIAGVTVGIIAIPLAMALAIASGVPPEYGLYTAVVAGFLIPLLGGSRFSVSGPTAAFIVVLLPVVQQYGLAGLLLATMLSGVMLMVMAMLRLGRFIEYVPQAVTLGFTAGIAVVIATLQLKDIFGLRSGEHVPTHYLEKLAELLHAASSAQWPPVLLSVTTLWLLHSWRKLNTPIPPHLPAVIGATLLAVLLNQFGYPVETIGSRFHYVAADGSQLQGIPQLLPQLQWPWHLMASTSDTLQFSSQLVKDLLTAAFAMAMLGAIESLLCAQILDGMTGKKHSANSELMAQGIGNVIAPLFGGITATAALARSSANLQAGAVSPIAAMVHALVVLAALVLLSPLLAYLPMAVMAALLLSVALHMSEAPKALQLINTAPRGDVLVFAVCFSLTVLFDMVIAISSGIIIAALLFVRDVAAMTKVTDVSENPKLVPQPLAPNCRVFRISGPLFFAAADRVFAELAHLSRNQQHVVLLLDGVSLLDSGGLAAFEKFRHACIKMQCHIHLVDLQFSVLKTLAKAKVKPIPAQLSFQPSLSDALLYMPQFSQIDPIEPTLEHAGL